MVCAALITTFYLSSVAWAQAARIPQSEKTETSVSVEENYQKKNFDLVAKTLWERLDRLSKREFVLLIRSHLELKQWDQALKASRSFASKHPEEASAHGLVGKSLLEMRVGKSHKEIKELEDQALEHLKKALELDPKLRFAYLEAASIYDKKDKPNLYEARILYQDMVQKLGPEPHFYNRLCEIEYLDGVSELALSACIKAAELSSKLDRPQVYLGLIHRDQGNLKKGNELLKSASRKFSKSVFALEKYAEAMIKDKNFIEAFWASERCIKVDSKNKNCLEHAGWSGAEIQKYDDSLRYLEMSCRQDKKVNTVIRQIAAEFKKRNNDSTSELFSKLAQKCSEL